MPVWHNISRKFVQQGKLVVLGVTQEQHSDRCRLFSQWQGFDWPILHDPINVLENKGVPIVVFIDENGIVRGRGGDPSSLEAFVNRQYAAVDPQSHDGSTVDHSNLADPSSFTALWESSRRSKAVEQERNIADAIVLWGHGRSLSEAIELYRQASETHPDDPRLLFRLGVASLMRAESDGSPNEVEDFGNAIRYWKRALDLDPSQYIWRRRIQQYGPRLDKPYPFYDWVETAVKEIRKRGDVPVELSVVPVGAEIAQPLRALVADTDVTPPESNSKIPEDTSRRVTITATVVPHTDSRQRAARVHLHLVPQPSVKWGDAAGPVEVWIEEAEGWVLDSRRLTARDPKMHEQSVARRLEFEIRSSAPRPASRLVGYVLYHVCDDVSGECVYLRQEFEVPVEW